VTTFLKEKVYLELGNANKYTYSSWLDLVGLTFLVHGNKKQNIYFSLSTRYHDLDLSNTHPIVADLTKPTAHVAALTLRPM